VVARERQARQLDLNVVASNAPAIGLYTSLGFRDEGALSGHPDVRCMALAL
jgi:ribosomal protein S18 acetylase RimI-like enzyme